MRGYVRFRTSIILGRLATNKNLNQTVLTTVKTIIIVENNETVKRKQSCPMKSIDSVKRSSAVKRFRAVKWFRAVKRFKAVKQL